MKSIKVLMMAVLTILSLNVFAQSKRNIKDTVQHAKVYTCAVHDTVAMKQPGNCPVCGMKLNLTTKDAMKMQATNQYSCPMHTDVVSDKPGTCSKCGMNLTMTAKEKMKAGFYCPMHADVVSDKAGKCSKCGMELVEQKKKN